MVASPTAEHPHGLVAIPPAQQHTDPSLMAAAATAAGASPASKPRRVRTGCLTCRERHLKCDEAAPICQNCRKSNRQCKRGVRLNFIDTQVRAPPQMVPERDWAVQFLDESRVIADEYVGGLERYAGAEEVNVQAQTQYQVQDGLLFEYQQQVEMEQQVRQQQQQQNQIQQHQILPPMHAIPDGYNEREARLDQQPQQRDTTQMYSAPSIEQMPPPMTPSYSYSDQNHAPAERGEYIRGSRELKYMQAFVEDVGVWMDSMDADKHFSEQIPHHALSSPMLYNAFLACGARHLSLLDKDVDNGANTGPSTASTDALQYYNTATSYLLQSLQAASGTGPERDAVTCATTATILNVYEVMSERYKQHINHINHIKGARALIRECNWDAKSSSGVGKACFWINIGMEVLSCLERGGRVAWDPEEWGVDTDWASGRIAIVMDASDVTWTHRILYVVAKIANFRSDVASPPGVAERQGRLAEWQHLRSLLEAWDRYVPRTMHPVAFIEPSRPLNHVSNHSSRAQTQRSDSGSSLDMSGSAFPEIWLIKRTAVMARLLYHTGMILLSQSHPHHQQQHQNPRSPPTQLSADLANLAHSHAIRTCGIVAHSHDRGVSSIALRAIAVAGEILTDIGQQKEVLAVVERTARGTAWHVQDLLEILPLKWGWVSNNNDINANAGAIDGVPVAIGGAGDLPRTSRSRATSSARPPSSYSMSMQPPPPHPLQQQQHHQQNINQGSPPERSLSQQQQQPRQHQTSPPRASLPPPTAPMPMRHDSVGAAAMAAAAASSSYPDPSTLQHHAHTHPHVHTSLPAPGPYQYPGATGLGLPALAAASSAIVEARTGARGGGGGAQGY